MAGGMQQLKSTEKSWAKYRHNLKYLATGTSTMSKRPRYEPEEPCYIDHGKGCRVWDIDGNEYIDFRNALGPVTLGYCYPAVDEAIAEQLKKGIIFCHPATLEGEVAELIVELVPSAEKVRYLKTGGEALAAAIKVARAATGKDMVLQCGYNGWINSVSPGANILPQARSEMPIGVPLEVGRLHRTLPWADPGPWEKTFEEIGDKVAAVLVAMDYYSPEKGPNFMRELRSLTSKHGALLVTDEIVTGFRIAVGGLQEYCDVDVDMAVFSKGIANGMPISALTGKAQIMDHLEKAIVSSTFSGEALSLAAAKAAMTAHKEHDVVGHLNKMGTMLMDGMNRLFEEHSFPVEAIGLPVCSVLRNPEDPDDMEPVAALFRMAYKHGLSLYIVNYPNFSCTTGDIEEALDRLGGALAELRVT
jgi:glutamate-1-semialdehyde 2,1-aminomutase